MKLSMVLAHARARELSSISKVAKTDAVVVTYINLALIELYSRFQLATNEAIITLRPDIPKTIYTMNSTDSDVAVEGNPMPDTDFMAVVEAYNEDGTSISLNNETDPYSISTVAYNQLQIPLLGTQSYVSIIYRKNPTLITFTDDGNGNAVDVDIALPLQLLSALLYHIGYSAQVAMSGDGKAESNNYYTEFLRACDDARKLGVLTADSVVGPSVDDKGFL